jgi:hypothetical protein
MAAALAYSSALTSMVQGCIPSIVVQTKEYSSYEDELGSHGHDEPHDNNAFVLCVSVADSSDIRR